MVWQVEVYRLPMTGPDDVSELRKLIENGEVKPGEIAAIIAQTEGDAYARGYAALNFELMLAEKLDLAREEVSQRIPMLMIGLTGGLMSPHYTVFTRRRIEQAPAKEKKFVLGVKTTRILLPEEYGTVTQVNLVAEAVREAMAEAEIAAIEDVHCVEVKCPAMTGARVQDALARGKKLITADPGAASSRAKGASALGVAVALGEVDPDRVTDQAICADWSLYSNVASTSAGNEQVACRVLVMGNSLQTASRYRIGHGVMKDTLDLEGAKEALRQAGMRFDQIPAPEELKRLAAMFINAGANASGSIRGRRHTMLSDYLSGYAGVFAKAVVNAVVGSLVGDTMILASAGFEHQGSPGANLVAAIVQD